MFHTDSVGLAGDAGAGRGGGLGGMLAQMAQPQGGQPGAERGGARGPDFGAIMQQMMPLVSNVRAELCMRVGFGVEAGGCQASVGVAEGLCR